MASTCIQAAYPYGHMPNQEHCRATHGAKRKTTLGRELFGQTPFDLSTCFSKWVGRLPKENITDFRIHSRASFAHLES